MRALIFIVLMTASTLAQAQRVNIFKPEVEVWKDSLEKPKIQFLFAFDAYRSFVLGQAVKLNGIKLGVEKNHTHRFGVGFYALSTPVVIPNEYLLVRQPDGMDYYDTVDLKFRFNYVSIFYERVLLKNRKWELAVPVHFGSGNVKATFRDSANVKHDHFEYSLPVFTGSAMAQYNIWSWFAVGTGFGYRGVVAPDDHVHEMFDGFMYSFRAKVMLVPLYKAIFKKKKSNTETPESQ